MKINGRLLMAEGADIKNLTAPSGPEWPADPNDAEIFFKTTPTKSLYVYRDGTWNDLLGGSATAAAEFITATADVNFPLPSALYFDKVVYRIKRIDSMAYSVVLVPVEGQLIERQTKFDLFPQESLTLMGYEGNWYII